MEQVEFFFWIVFQQNLGRINWYH